MNSNKSLRKINTKLIILVFVFLCFFISGNKIFALDSSNVKVEDNAGLLTLEEESEIYNRATQVLNENNKDWYVDIFVIDDSEGKTTFSYATDRYEELNDPENTGKVLNGFFIIVDMDNRNYHFGTFGEAIDFFDEYETDRLLDEMFDYISSGEYFSAINAALDTVDARLQQGDQHTGNGYIGNEYGGNGGNGNGNGNGNGYDGNNSVPQGKKYEFTTPVIIALLFASGVSLMYYRKVVKDYDKYESKPMFNYAKNSIVEYSEFEDLISNRQRFRVYQPLRRENISNSDRYTSYSGGSDLSGGGRNVGGGGRSF